MPNLLLYRLAIFNLIAFVAVAWAWALGWVQYIYDGDVTKIVVACAGLFLIGLVSTFNQAVKLVRGKYENAKVLVARQLHIERIAEWLVMIALIGTVVGISMAMGGNLDLGSTESIKAFTAHMLQHIHVAFNVTITGCLLSFWTAVNYGMLYTATVEATEA